MKAFTHPATLLKLFIFCVAILVRPATWAGEEEIETESLLDQIELDPLVVVASRAPRPLSQVSAQVTIINIDDIRAGMVEDLDGLLKYEPGLEVETAGTRFGTTGINIRGVSGNRVGIEIDGVPVGDIGDSTKIMSALTDPDEVEVVTLDKAGAAQPPVVIVPPR